VLLCVLGEGAPEEQPCLRGDGLRKRQDGVERFEGLAEAVVGERDGSGKAVWPGGTRQPGAVSHG
jgi:hypothetical protein